ncbi:MAG TPA: SIMPL domain-containing protein [Nitrosopumilaceae archaeon]|nr:SIMPL domain-containing protein [Nitrosopumilaceae archaeon]
MTTNRTKAMLATLAVIAIVSTVIVASMQTSQDQAYGQQVPVSFTTSEKTITVTGTAATSISPDIVTLQFGVDTEAKTAQDAISENAQAMDSVVTAVIGLGITKDEISTASFSIYPVYNYTVPDPYTGIQKTTLTGYKASNILFVKTNKLSLTGKIIDSAVGAGTNRVDSVSFSLSPALQQGAQNDLISKAVLDAKSKAEKALDPLGKKIVGVKTVNLSDYVPPRPMYYAAGVSAAKDTQIFSSDQDVTTTADVIFLIGDQ